MPKLFDKTQQGLIKPAALQAGQTIGLIAPSSPCWVDEGIDQSIRLWESWGYHVVVAPHCRESVGYLAGADQSRASDVNAFFADPQIDAIFCIRGGYGASRMIEYLDWPLIRRNPKIFVGYSDITVLHTALQKEASMVTFHGPMPVSDMLSGFEEFSQRSLFATLLGQSCLTSNPSQFPLKSLTPGTAEGVLCGGNLTLLHAMAGTAWDIDTRGKILFLEDIDEEPFDIDRMLTNLRLRGKLKDCAGFLLGEWTSCESRGSYQQSMTAEQVLEDLLIPLGKPILSGVRAGHCSPTLTLPLGVSVQVDASGLGWSVLECPVTQ